MCWRPHCATLLRFSHQWRPGDLSSVVEHIVDPRCSTDFIECNTMPFLHGNDWHSFAMRRPKVTWSDTIQVETKAVPVRMTSVMENQAYFSLPDAILGSVSGPHQSHDWMMGKWDWMLRIGFHVDLDPCGQSEDLSILEKREGSCRQTIYIHLLCIIYSHRDLMYFSFSHHVCYPLCFSLSSQVFCVSDLNSVPSAFVLTVSEAPGLPIMHPFFLLLLYFTKASS